MALRPQQQLQRGKYTIDRELGRGRFGITYLARDRDGNGIAIKTLNDETLNDPTDFDRWQQKFVQETFKLRGGVVKTRCYSTSPPMSPGSLMS